MILKKEIKSFAIYSLVFCFVSSVFLIFMLGGMFFCIKNVSDVTLVEIVLLYIILFAIIIFVFDITSFRLIYKVEYTSKNIVCHSLLKKYIVMDNVVYNEGLYGYILRYDRKKLIFLKYSTSKKLLYTKGEIEHLKQIMQNINAIRMN